MVLICRNICYILIFYQFYVVEDAGGRRGRLEDEKSTLLDFDENSVK